MSKLPKEYLKHILDDYEIVWDVIKTEIPKLKQQIQGILKTDM